MRNIILPCLILSVTALPGSGACVTAAMEEDGRDDAAGMTAGRNGATGLMRSSLLRESTMGNTEKVKLLLKRGANVNATSDTGVTALMAAVEEGHSEMVKLLLHYGAEVNRVSRPDPAAGRVAMTPLMAAASCGNAVMVKLLVEHGADASAEIGETAKYFAGVTALLLAAAKGHTGTAELLMQAGTGVEWLWKYMVMVTWCIAGSFIWNRGCSDPQQHCRRTTGAGIVKIFLLLLVTLLLCSCTAFDQSRSILQDLTAATKAAASMGRR